MTSTQLNTAVLEILLHIGNSFETKRVVDEALISYIQQLNLAGIVLCEKKDINYTVHTMKPKNLKSDKTIFKIFDNMILNLNEFEKNILIKIPHISKLKIKTFIIFINSKSLVF